MIFTLGFAQVEKAQEGSDMPRSVALKALDIFGRKRKRCDKRRFAPFRTFSAGVKLLCSNPSLKFNC